MLYLSKEGVKGMENKHLNTNELKPRTWLLYVLIVINIVIIVVLANKVITDKQNKQNDKNSLFDNFFDKVDDTVNNNDYVSEIEKKSFNSTLEMYAGTEYGSSVSWLIDKVITNNKTNSEHILTVVFEDVNSTDTEEIRNIKKSLDDWTKYEVILDYDENGFVYLITIEK